MGSETEEAMIPVEYAVDLSAHRAREGFVYTIESTWVVPSEPERATVLGSLRSREIGRIPGTNSLTRNAHARKLTETSNPWTVKNMLMSPHFSLFAARDSFNQWYSQLALTRLVKEVIGSPEWGQWVVVSKIENKDPDVVKEYEVLVEKISN
jgi:hypothetical protein